MNVYLATFGFVALAAPSCQSPRTAPGLEQRVQMLNGVPPHIVVDACSLRQDTGVPLFACDLRNSSLVSTSNLEWLVEFQDELGIQVAASDSRWFKVSLGPGESKQVQLVASSPSARQFRLKIRPRQP